MTQSTTLKFLQKNKKKWMTAKEIAEKLGISHGSVTANLKKLKEQGLVTKRNKSRIQYEWRFRN